MILGNTVPYKLHLRQCRL